MSTNQHKNVLEPKEASQSMDMHVFPISFRRSFDSGSNYQELPLTISTPGKTLILQNTARAENLTTSRRRQQQILIVLSCLALTITGCGFNFAFGVYQEHYETFGGPFNDATPGEIGLIGTLAASLMTIGAPFASSWTRTYGPRPVTAFGGVLFAVAGISASFGTRLWHFQLTQGVLQGCAACLAYIPAVTVSPAFFNERRGLAMGIILSGTGLGGMLWAPVLRYLITEMGFRNTLRTAGVMAATIITTSALALKEAGESRNGEVLTRHVRGSQSKSILPGVNWKIVRSKEFLAHASGGALHSAAYFIPVYFMSSYARTLGYSNNSGAHIIAWSNACNFGGKIIIGYLADIFGRFNALFLSVFASAFVNFGLSYASNAQLDVGTSRTLFLAYVTIYGLTAGSYVSLFPTALVEQFGIRDFASINGLLYMIRGFGTLAGTSVGGALIRSTKDFKHTAIGYDRTFLFVAIMLSGTTISVAWARRIKTQGEWEWRV